MMGISPRFHLLTVTVIGLLTVAGGTAVARSVSSVEDSAQPTLTTTSSTVIETTTSSTTPSSTTTSSTTTTTTVPLWPLTPVKPLPAVGLVPVLSKVDTKDPVVFLTIDDGAIRDHRVLELVETYKIPVSLFLNEGPLRADPDYFRRITAFGGSINSHTRTHPLLTRMSAGAQREQICGMKNVIAEYVFVPGHLMRAPFGESNAATQTASSSCGINAVLFWHVALNGGKVQYQQGNALQPGDIILAHFRTDLYDNILALSRQAALQGMRIAPIEAYLPLPN